MLVIANLHVDLSFHLSFRSSTPAHAVTKRMNLPVRRPPRGPSALAMVRHTPSFKVFARPKEADNMEEVKVRMNKGGVSMNPPPTILWTEVSPPARHEMTHGINTIVTINNKPLNNIVVNINTDGTASK